MTSAREGGTGVRKLTMKLWMVEDGRSGKGGGFRVLSARPHKISLLNRIEKGISSFHSSNMPFGSHRLSFKQDTLQHFSNLGFEI